MKTHHHPSKTTLVTVGLVLVLAALSAAATHASASTSTSSATPRRSVQIIRVTARGFDWGAAGIGAAAGIGISMLAVGASLILTTPKPDHKPRVRLTAKEQP